jgi:formylglycine-generating enzyme required for sulfatase activity
VSSPSGLARDYLRACRRLMWWYRGTAAVSISMVAAIAAATVWLYGNGLTLKHGEAMVLSTMRLYPVSAPAMVELPAGEFWMGAGENDREGNPLERPQHRVVIERPFAMGEYEVTFAEYEQFAYATGRLLPSDQGWGKERRPVINVSWDEATAYAEWLSRMTGDRYRLPTEAEWEYAARAGTEWARFWGDDLDEACQYANVADQSFRSRGYGGEIHNCDDGYAETAEVGSFKPNDFGLHDMLGNVWEWVQDCPHDYSERASDDGSAWEEAECGLRVFRGGSWIGEPAGVRSAYRGWSDPVSGTTTSGFVSPRTFSPLFFVLLPFAGVQGRSPWSRFFGHATHERYNPSRG